MAKANDTLFVPLPKALHRPINGGCQCPYCKAHPELVPSWDTPAGAHDDHRHTWTVHYPELG